MNGGRRSADIPVCRRFGREALNQKRSGIAAQPLYRKGLRIRVSVVVFWQVLELERLRDNMFLAEPFSEIDQLAALRAERPVSTCKPIPLLIAGGTFHWLALFHR